ncbi:MAG: FAD-binding oxidoreductase [Acidimicrobiales bacterium]|nr:FAD-binding oxidoreductase [Acidimicrobiales bacterium]
MSVLGVEVAVVGLGLIGSAATRHLANAGRRVVGIGPAEPKDWGTYTDPFASYFDSGRITRRLDARREWAILASRAIDQYGAIEAQSGISFHTPSGLTFVRRDPRGIANQTEVIRQLQLPVTISRTELQSPAHYCFPAGWTTLTEPAPAGAIDPRRMVCAQLTVAEMAGAEILRESAQKLTKTNSGWQIRTTTARVEAELVLLATGPYLDTLHSFRVEACVRPEAVILGQISDREADRLSDLQSVIYLLDHRSMDDIYVCPPVRYPDGRFRIKMGGSRVDARTLETSEAKRAWMAGNDADTQLPVMTEILTTILPDVAFESFEIKPCLITDTSSGLPFVDRIDENLFIAAGGNGHAAKSADAIGALGATLVLNDGEWTDLELDRDQFGFRRGQWSPTDGSRHGT